MFKFQSPQTGSLYNTVFDPSIFVAYRPIGYNQYRVRIQSNDEAALEALRAHLKFNLWSYIKDGDHISIVVDGFENVINTVNDATQAILRLRGEG